jgi:glutamyl-Q tRNA(Asp) synthetase
VPGATQRIIETLQRLGLVWDGDCVFQSRRTARYAEIVERLRAQAPLFHCDCSRARLLTGAAPSDRCCSGDCRRRALAQDGAALRIDLTGLPGTSMIDRSLGPIAFDPVKHRDLVIRRRDGVYAYHLCTAIDDHDSGVTDVVRGADLLDSTPWQIALRAALGWPHPRYLHVPLVTEPDGRKLAKSARSRAVFDLPAAQTLRQALEVLGQRVPEAAATGSATALLQAVVEAWDPGLFSGMRQRPLSH